MFVTGPNVVKEVLNEDVSFDDLGGAEVHAQKSGVAQMVFEDEENTLMGVRKLISYLPANNLENPPETDISNRGFNYKTGGVLFLKSGKKPKYIRYPECPDIDLLTEKMKGCFTNLSNKKCLKENYK